MHPSEIGACRRKPKQRNVVKRNIFEEVNAAARLQIKALAERWLSQTRMSGDNLMAVNPTREDKSIGSFSINVRSGAWADFATGDAGGDIISFFAYLHGMSQIEAARELANILGVDA